MDLSHSPTWQRQLGSLGGGNHFIELCLDERDRVWLFLHSGSRGVGNKIAQRHIKAAQQLCKRWWIDLPSPELAYLAQGTPEFNAYLTDRKWAQAFAFENRAEMMDRFVRAVEHGAGRQFFRTEARKRFTADDLAARMTGIAYRHGKERIDGSPDADKDIDQVMADARDLVDVEHELRQLPNVKGI